MQEPALEEKAREEPPSAGIAHWAQLEESRARLEGPRGRSRRWGAIATPSDIPEPGHLEGSRALARGIGAGCPRPPGRGPWRWLGALVKYVVAALAATLVGPLLGRILAWLARFLLRLIHLPPGGLRWPRNASEMLETGGLGCMERPGRPPPERRFFIATYSGAVVEPTTGAPTA